MIVLLYADISFSRACDIGSFQLLCVLTVMFTLINLNIEYRVPFSELLFSV